MQSLKTKWSFRFLNNGRLFVALLGTVYSSSIPARATGILVPTKTAITASQSSSFYGQYVVFTAQVSGLVSVVTPGGTVTFYDRNAAPVTQPAPAIGSATITNGYASLNTNSLSAGSHAIYASYNGNGSFAESSSSVLFFAVSPANVTITVLDSSNPSTFSAPATIQATVSALSPATGVPTGEIAFNILNNYTQFGILNGSGSATWDLHGLAPGTYQYQLIFPGYGAPNPNYVFYQSPVYTHTVSKAFASVAVTATPNPAVFGQPVAVEITTSSVAPASFPPSGAVTLLDSGSAISTVTMLANGLASSAGTLTTPFSMGAHTLSASYPGDTNFFPVGFGFLTLNVNKDTPSITVASSVNPSASGQSLTFTATLTPTYPGTLPSGSVTFMDAANTLGKVALSNGQASFATSTLATGTHLIRAVYSGDSNFAGTSSSALSQKVGSAAPTTAATSTSISSSLNPANTGQSVTFTALVTSPGSGTPTGTVMFDDGASTLGSTALSGGRAAFATSALAAGTHSITAIYSGDANFVGSTSAALNETVAPGAQTNPPSVLAHFAAGDTWTTGIFVVNTGNQAGQFSISFFGDDGTPATLPFATGSASTLASSVAANGSAYFEAADPRADLISGWARITADPSLVVQALFRDEVDGVFYEAAVPSSPGGNEFLVPFDATTFAATGVPFYTGLAVANLDDSPATIACIARDPQGVVIANAVQVPALGPLGHWASFLFPALTGQRGSIDCTSDTNIAATALRFIGSSAFSSLPVILNPASFAGGGSSALAHFAAGSTWTTGFFVLNTSATAAQFSIAFRDDNGNPVAPPFGASSASTLSGTVAAHGSAYYEAANPQVPLVEGWAQITADPAIVVQALFRNDSSGTYYEAAEPSSPGSKEFLLPFDATTFAGNGQPFYTGFAIANLDDSPAQVTCTARDQNGNVIPDAVLVPGLNPMGHWDNYLFPALAGSRGTLDCVSNTKVAATALRFIGVDAFCSLPVITK